MTDITQTPPTSGGAFDDLENFLYWGAIHEARIAVGTYGSDDLQTMRRAAMAMGAAAEHLLSSAIVAVDPVLLADPRDVASVVSLSRANKTSRLDPARLRTAPWDRQLRILEEVHVSIRIRPDMTSLMTTRNAAAHAALVTASNLGEAAVALARVVEGLHTALPHRDEARFWGGRFMGTVEELRNVRSSATRQRVSAKIAHAKDSLEKILFGLSEDGRTRMLVALEARLTSATVLDAETVDEECPACGRQGELSLLTEKQDEPRYEADYDRDGSPVAQYAVFGVLGYPTLFQCPVCGLSLEQDELESYPNLSADRDLEEVWEDAAAYFDSYEPDEDWLRGR